MLRKKIYRYIRPIRQKLYIERSLKVLSWILVIGFGLTCLLAIVSRFVMVVHVTMWMGYVGLVAMATSIIVSAFLYPSVQDGVKLTDHLGMQERLMTALEFEDSQEAAITSQREDTLLHIEDITKRPSYSIKIWRRPWLIAGILFVGTLGVLMVPTSSSKQAAQIEELQEKIIEEMAWIEEKLDQDLLEEKIADAADIEEKEKAIEEALEALKENIEKAKSEEEALKELAIAKNALSEIEKEIAEQLKAQSQEAMGEETALAMEKALEAMGSELHEMQAAINASGQNLATKASISQMAFSGEPANGSEPSQSSGAMAGSGENPQEGEGEGQGGAGAQEGEGQGASAIGSTNEETPMQETTEPQGGHHQGGESKEGIYESLYPPERLGGEADPSFIQGDSQKEGERTYSEVQGVPTEAGEFVRYDTILSEYSSEATRRIDQAQVPPMMRTVVKEYFSSLETSD